MKGFTPEEVKIMMDVVYRESGKKERSDEEKDLLADAYMKLNKMKEANND